jgi:glycosyltransferase involved in cell wall biosynthesis
MDASTRKLINQHFSQLPQVTFHNYTVKIHEIYPQYDVFIASSVSDSGPRTVIEALACGLPAIVSSHCGTADLVENGLNGFTYEPFDLDRLKSLIMWFVDHRDKVELMGLKAHNRAKTLSYDNFLEEMYHTIVREYEKRGVHSYRYSMSHH